jgi:anti-sigma-K factor RskA
MLDDEKITQPLGGVQLLSYTLGELDVEAQQTIEGRIAADPALKQELEDIRAHLKLHQDVRKVAPRRGSFERLQARMKKEGALLGAVPGVHCMLRRAFMLALLVGMAAVAILIAVGRTGGPTAAPDVIGQIVYHNPSLTVGQRRAEVARRELQLRTEADAPENTGAYDAWVWLPTGVSNTYSTIELTQSTEFKFTRTRRVALTRGFMRRLEVQPGGMGEGPFVVVTPHCLVQVDRGSLSINVTRDGVETQISVGAGSARVYGLDSDRSFPVPAGYCTSVERGKLPNPARPLLKLLLDRVTGSNSLVEATLLNDGFVPVKVRRAIDTENAFAQPIYLLHHSHVSEYSPEGTPENFTRPPEPVTPADRPQDHTGDVWLEPGQYYRFEFDISPMLITAPRVEHWLRLEYRGDLYGPPGQARVRIESANLKLDLRNR